MAAAFVLMIGAGIALASGALDDRGSGRGQNARATAPPPPVATLITPDPALTRADAADIAGVLPDGLDRNAVDGLRLYVNDERVRERDLPSEANFTLNDVPLGEGDNEIRISLIGEGGEGEQSAPITVVRDSTSPEIQITQPEPDSTAYGGSETLRGRTEAGASIEVVEDGSNRPVAVQISGDGRFQATLHLELGNNEFVIRSEDPAGNKSSTRLAVTRAMSLGSINLSVSVDEVALADLPVTVNATAVVRDELGRAADGAAVTFSLSPPNRGTTTYQATTVNGQASWPNMVVTGERATGVWLVTVLATLPSGEELRGDASFSVQ